MNSMADLLNYLSDALPYGQDRQGIRILHEEDGARLEVDLPGVPREDIKVETKQGRLFLTVAPSDPGLKEKHAQSRTFTVPDKYDLDKVSARYRDGLLVVSVPTYKDARSSKVVPLD